MQTDSMFSEIKFNNIKCNSVTNLDQIKGKIDCFRFLSTPYAFDSMVLSDQDFYDSKKQTTFEKIENLTQSNISLLKNSKNIIIKMNSNKKKSSRKVQNQNNKYSTQMITLLDKYKKEEHLNRYENNSYDMYIFHELAYNKHKSKTHEEILNYFKRLSEKGLSITDVIKKINNFNEENNYSDKCVKNIIPDQENRVSLKSDSILKEYKISDKYTDKSIENSESTPATFFKKRSSSINHKSNCFITNPITFNKQCSRKTINSNLGTTKIPTITQQNAAAPMHKSNHYSKENFNNMLANIQTKEKQLLDDFLVEELCKLSMEKKEIEEKDLEKFFKIKKLEIESTKLDPPNMDKINNTKNIEQFCKFKKKSKSLSNYDYMKPHDTKKYNTKRIKYNHENQFSESVIANDLNQIDKKDIYKMIDFCHNSSKKNTNLLLRSFKDHYDKNKIVEDVLSKMKGKYNTPADEFIKNTTMEEFKKRGLFLYGNNQGYYNKNYKNIYGVEKDILKILNSIK